MMMMIMMMMCDVVVVGVVVVLCGQWCYWHCHYYPVVQGLCLIWCDEDEHEKEKNEDCQDRMFEEYKKRRRRRRRLGGEALQR